MRGWDREPDTSRTRILSEAVAGYVLTWVSQMSTTSRSRSRKELSNTGIKERIQIITLDHSESKKVE